MLSDRAKKAGRLLGRIKGSLFVLLVIVVTVFFVFCSYLSSPFGVYRVGNNFMVKGLKQTDSIRKSANNVRSIRSGSFHITFEDKSIAKILQKQVRILCFILTTPANHYSKIIHVKNTWGKRCHILLFISTLQDDAIPTIALPVIEEYAYLWGKTKAAFQYVYDNYRDQADWFLKADDDTYVIVENLRYMLSSHSPQEPVYFGCHFATPNGAHYMSGGAGYVLSRAALNLFVEVGLPSKEFCRQDNVGIEDLEVGICLEKIGVKTGDSRDSLGRGRFWPLNPESFTFPNAIDRDSWFWNYTQYPLNDPQQNCSDYTISFHSINPQTMYVLEFLIYHLKPFGVSNYYLDLTHKEEY